MPEQREATSAPARESTTNQEIANLIVALAAWADWPHRICFQVALQLRTAGITSARLRQMICDASLRRQ
jgi:hypothetical protein